MKYFRNNDFWNVKFSIGKTFYDYLRNLWNDTKSQKGIYLMYEKVLYPIGKDEDGNLIYEYRGKEL